MVKLTFDLSSKVAHFDATFVLGNLTKMAAPRAGQLDWNFFNRSSRKKSFVPGDSVTI